MASATEHRDDSELIELLHARGRRVTPQRLVILRELRRLGTHVTAEEIHHAARRDLPGTSVPTVYATLDLLVELGLARKLDFGLGSSLYDGRTEPHQHAVCRGCGRIEDVDVRLPDGVLRRAGQGAGFRVDGAELLLQGLCAECAGPRAPGRGPGPQDATA